MKAEERIIELLAEYLKKTDNYADRTSQTEKSVDIMSRAIAEHSIKFNEMNEKFHEQNQKFNEQNERFDKRFNEQNGNIQSMLKELIFLSKRVSVIEERR